MGENAKDFEYFVNLFGFTPMEVIVAATRHGADLMQMGHEAGQIKAGFYADLVILDGDPLADIRIFQDQDRILGVMKGGQFAKRDPALSRVTQTRCAGQAEQTRHRHAFDYWKCSGHRGLVWRGCAPDALAPLSG